MSELINRERGHADPEVGEGYFVKARGKLPDGRPMPQRYEESPGTPAWRRALEIGANQRRN